MLFLVQYTTARHFHGIILLLLLSGSKSMMADFKGTRGLWRLRKNQCCFSPQLRLLRARLKMTLLLSYSGCGHNKAIVILEVVGGKDKIPLVFIYTVVTPRSAMCFTNTLKETIRTLKSLLKVKVQTKCV